MSEESTTLTAAPDTSSAENVGSQTSVTGTVSVPENEKATTTTTEKQTETTTEKTQESVVPETYELKLAEGFELPEQSMQEVADLARSLGLSNENAQALLTREASVVRSTVESINQAHLTEAATWEGVTKADPEMGGDNHTVTMQNAQKAFAFFGSDALKTILEDTRYGDHPELIRAFSRVGAAMSEDKFVPGGTATTELSQAETLYGKSE